MNQTETAAQVVDFVPYRVKDGIKEFFLQRRTDNAPRFPGFFALFGGFISENETPEQGFLKRIQEELKYTPKNYTHIGVIQLPRKDKYVYLCEVESDFEEKIKITEGLGGKWFKIDEIFEDYLAPWIMPQDLLVLALALDIYKKY